MAVFWVQSGRRLPTFYGFLTANASQTTRRNNPYDRHIRIHTYSQQLFMWRETFPLWAVDFESTIPSLLCRSYWKVQHVVKDTSKWWSNSIQINETTSVTALMRPGATDQVFICGINFIQRKWAICSLSQLTSALWRPHHFSCHGSMVQGRINPEDHYSRNSIQKSASSSTIRPEEDFFIYKYSFYQS